MLTVWRNSYNSENEPVKFAGGWILGEAWKTIEWKNNPHAIVEVRQLHDSTGGIAAQPVRDGDVFYSHRLLNLPDPEAKFYYAKTGEPYTPVGEV